MTTLLGLLIVLLALYLAFKLLESVLKVLGWVLILAVGYWLAAPSLGWPPLPELIELAWLDVTQYLPEQWLTALWDLFRTETGSHLIHHI